MQQSQPQQTPQSSHTQLQSSQQKHLQMQAQAQNQVKDLAQAANQISQQQMVVNESNSNNMVITDHQRKLQMAENIVSAVQMEKLMRMPFTQMENLHIEIMTLLQKHGLSSQQQSHQRKPTQNSNSTTAMNIVRSPVSVTNGNDLQMQSENQAQSQQTVLAHENHPIEIVLVLLHQYPQIKEWLSKMDYHGTVTTSDSHAVQFLSSLMGSQPQFTKLIETIQEQLQTKREQNPEQTISMRCAEIAAENAQQAILNSNTCSTTGISTTN